MPAIMLMHYGTGICIVRAFDIAEHIFDCINIINIREEMPYKEFFVYTIFMSSEKCLCNMCCKKCDILHNLMH